MNITTRKHTELALALLLLAMGGAVYLLYRPQTLLLYYVVRWMGLADVVGQWRTAAMAAGELPPVVVYSLPAGLWATSYVLIAASVSRGHRPSVRLLAASIIPLLGAVSELLQGCGLLPGTFDVVDLVLYLLPVILFAITIKINNTTLCKTIFPVSS